MLSNTIEIIDGRERRRRWGLEEKLRIVAETYEPGATVGAVAARHDVYPSLLRNWLRQGCLAAVSTSRFVPVHVAETTPTTPAVSPPISRPAVETIEIILPDGSRLRVGDDVSVVALRRVMTVLRG